MAFRFVLYHFKRKATLKLCCTIFRLTDFAHISYKSILVTLLNIVIKRVVSDFCPFYATEDIVFFAITRHRCISSETKPNQLCVLSKNIIHYTHKQSL